MVGAIGHRSVDLRGDELAEACGLSAPDIINGLFETAGSLLTWANAYRVYKDKGYAGIYAPAVLLFTAWGAWNLYYYPHLGQWWSFAGGVSLVLANVTWLGLMLRYGRVG